MAEAYEIGVKILMSGNVAEALGAMSSRLLGIHGQVKEIEKNLANWKGLALGAAAVFGGIELFKGLKDIVEHGAKLEHFEAQAKAAGLTVAEQGRVMSAAWANVGANINASVTDSVKNLLELRQATGSVDEAIKMLPAFTRTENALHSLKDDDLKGHVGSTLQSYNFARSLELLAVTQDPKKLDAYIAAMTREMIGMRGLVDGSTFMEGLKNAGGSRYAWNADFVGNVFGPLLQENMRNAVGLYQLDRSFGAGVMTEMMSQGAEKYGLFDKKDEFRDAHGRFKGMQTGSIVGYNEMRANPEAWALDVVLPLLKAHGVDTNDTNAMSKAITEMSRGNKNLNVILDALLLPANRQLLAKERANIGAVPEDAAGILQKNDPGQAMAAFSKAWDNLLTALGKPLVHTAVVALESMASAIDEIATTLARHPTMTKIGAELAAISAGLLTLAGSIAVVKFALAIGRGAGTLAAAGATAGATGAKAAAAATAAASSAPGGIPGLGWFRLGAFAWNSLSMLDSGDIGTPEWAARINAFDKKWNDWIFNHFGLGAPADPFPIDSTAHVGGWFQHSPFWHSERARADSALGRAGYRGDDLLREMSRESSRGRALGTPPNVSMTNQINNKLTIYIDGRQLVGKVVAEVESHLFRGAEFTHRPSLHDDMASYAAPDMSNT